MYVTAYQDMYVSGYTGASVGRFTTRRRLLVWERKHDDLLAGMRAKQAILQLGALPLG